MPFTWRSAGSCRRRVRELSASPSVGVQLERGGWRRQDGSSAREQNFPYSWKVHGVEKDVQNGWLGGRLLNPVCFSRADSLAHCGRNPRRSSTNFFCFKCVLSLFRPFLLSLLGMTFGFHFSYVAPSASTSLNRHHSSGTLRQSAILCLIL